MANFAYNPRFSFQVSRKIEKATGVKLHGPANVQDLMILFEDLSKFVDALWLLVEPQVIEAGQTREQFEDTLDGETLGSAQAAVQEAFIQFCPAHQRNTVKDLFAKWEFARQQAVAEMQKVLESGVFRDQVTAAIADEVARIKDSFAVSA